MLESSTPSRRAEYRPFQQSIAPQVQPTPMNQSRSVRRKSAPRNRSGLQRLLFNLLRPKTETAGTKRGLSRREQRRQQRGLSAPSSTSSKVELIRRSQSSVHPGPVHSSSGHSRDPRGGETRERSIVPLDVARSKTSSKQHSARPHPGVSPAPHARQRPSSAHLNAKASDKRAPDKRHQSQKRSFPISAFIQGVRLVILGVGVWAIVGTALSMTNSQTRSDEINQPASDDPQQNPAYVQQVDITQNAANLRVGMLESGQEMSELTARVTPLTQGFTDLTPSVFLIDLDSGNHFSLNGEASFSAASMIKVPILVAFFQDVDAGKIRLDEMLTMQEGDIGSGSGEMQFDPIGSQYTALETATNMIIISDNTATNMLIRRLGGIEALNQRFQEWGLQTTVLRNLLPDLEGTNTTSARELSMLIARVSEGDLVSMKSRDRLFNIMQRTLTDSLIPASVSQDATVAHKTGDIGSLVGDTGLVDMPNGKRYAVTLMVKRPHNDERAQEMIRQISAMAYEYLNQAPAASTASPPPSPEGSVTPTDGAVVGENGTAR